MSSDGMFVLIHVGAGRHQRQHSGKFKHLLKSVCNKAADPREAEKIGKEDSGNDAESESSGDELELECNDLRESKNSNDSRNKRRKISVKSRPLKLSKAQFAKNKYATTCLYGSSSTIALPRSLLMNFSMTSKAIETSGFTNTSVGSSLTVDGFVSNDALVFVSDGNEHVLFGLTGITKFMFPITRCLNHLAVEEFDRGCKSIGVTKSCFSVDNGAVFGYLDDGPCSKSSLISKSALASWKYWARQREKAAESLLLQEENPIFNGNATGSSQLNSSVMDNSHTLDVTQPVTDTIGILCTSQNHTLAGVSSGGNALKPNGRIGCASVYGAGYCCLKSDDVPILRNSVGDKYEISLFASGNGEQIVHSSLCRTCCEHVLSKLYFDEKSDIYGASEILSESIPANSYVGLVGTISCQASNSKYVIYAHTTESFVFAFQGSKTPFEYVFSEKLKSADSSVAILHGQIRS